MEYEDAFRIRATSSSTADRSYVLKDGELFAIFDQFGDVQSAGTGSQGLYLGGTRHLSRLALLVAGAPPLLLSSTVRLDNAVMVVDLTNPDLEGAKGDSLRGDTLHIRRMKLLLGQAYWEELTVQNHSSAPFEFILSVLFDCDYADVFEVRGMRRAKRGERLAARVDNGQTVHGYRGLDGVLRQTAVRFNTKPDALTAYRADFRVALEPKAQKTIVLEIVCESNAESATPKGSVEDFSTATTQLTKKLEGTRAHCAEITTVNELFDQWLARSFTDLHMLTTYTAQGPYPYAGIPWFSTAFGRDGIITALECLWWNPDLARGVLRYLAARQATTNDAAHDAQPGKILHERRLGEMAALGEIPFGEYYGSVDSTPLFVHLAGAYVERTADLDFAQEIWPTVDRCLEWITSHGDADGDGYVEYCRRSESGLLQQGWKDSGDSIFHADGSDAEAPIALCEVQGYVYAAYRSAAMLAQTVGKQELATALSQRAGDLKTRFDRDFWNDEIGCYALALDGRKRQCAVLTSNAGQCLWTGIVPPNRAKGVVRAMMDDRMYSGWGVRTLATSERRYNPLAYHNGSVWPHDTALIGYGMSRCGFKGEAARLLDDLFGASCYFGLHRLPEVFCGFSREQSTGPVRYPVACLPQAWAAGSVYLLLQAAFGLSIDARAKMITLVRPTLPPSLKRVHLSGLRCGAASIDLVLTKHAGDVGVEVSNRQGDLQVTVIK